MTVSPEIIGPLFDGNDKVAIAIARIRQFEPPDGYAVAFSGGKDSIVIYDLVKRADVKHEMFYSLTTVDPPELVAYIRKQYPDVAVIRPKMTMWQLIVHKRLPPTRMARYCCDVLKHPHRTGKLVVTGVRRAESIKRKGRRVIELCRNGDKTLNPIVDWEDADVWSYIKRKGIKYCSLYDEGFKRLGCVMCPLTSNMKKEMERWPKIAEAYKRAICRSFEKMKSDGKLSPDKSWKKGEDMWEWWINGGIGPIDNEDQFNLFE